MKHHTLTTILKPTMKAHPLTHQSHTRPQMIIMSLILKPTEFDTHITSYTQLLSELSNYCETTPQLNEPSQLNADPTIDIHVAQSESNKMSHDYHAQNGLPDEVVGDFSDNEDEILADNNNINDDNGI